jgi:hypothetical protein
MRTTGTNGGARTRSERGRSGRDVGPRGRWKRSERASERAGLSSRCLLPGRAGPGREGAGGRHRKRGQLAGGRSGADAEISSPGRRQRLELGLRGVRPSRDGGEAAGPAGHAEASERHWQ